MIDRAKLTPRVSPDKIYSEQEYERLKREGREIFRDREVRVKAFIGPDVFYTIDEYDRYQTELREEDRDHAERMRTVEEYEVNHPRKRTLEILSRAYNREIKRMVFGDKRHLVEGFNKIKITHEAYEKAQLISKRTLDITNTNEIYLHLLNDRDKMNDPVIRDVHILRGQKITNTSCGSPSHNEEELSFKEIEEQGKYICAWAHSHGTMSTFHSQIDVNNLDASVSVYGGKVKLTPKPFSNSSRSFEFRFMPSIVFNAKGDKPSCYIGITYPGVHIGKGFERVFYMNKNPVLEIIDEKNGIVLDRDTIDREIEERTNYFGKKEIVSKKEKRKVSYVKESERKDNRELNEEFKPEERDYIQGLKEGFRRGRTGYEKRLEELENLCKKYESVLLNHEERLYECKDKLDIHEEKISNLEQKLSGSSKN